MPSALKVRTLSYLVFTCFCTQVSPSQLPPPLDASNAQRCSVPAQFPLQPPGDQPQYPRSSRTNLLSCVPHHLFAGFSVEHSPFFLLSMQACCWIGGVYKGLWDLALMLPKDCLYFIAQLNCIISGSCLVNCCLVSENGQSFNTVRTVSHSSTSRFKSFYYFESVVQDVHSMQHTWRSDSLGESFLTFHHVGPWNLTHVYRLGHGILTH